MGKRALLCTVGCLLLFGTGPARAELGPVPPEPDRLWFMLCAQSPIANGSDYDQRLRFLTPSEKIGEPMPEFRLEFREGKTQKPVLSFDFAPFRKPRDIAPMSTSFSGIPQAERGRLGSLPEGEYLVAVTQSGTRCSNVARFAIEKGFKTEELPVLEAFALEPPPYRELPFLGLRVAGSSGFSKPIRNSDACYAELTVDGVVRRWTATVWGGVDPELRPGARWVTIVDPAGFLAPPIEPGKDHQLEVRAREYRAGPILFNPGVSDGEAWDAATLAGQE